ncbi:MAG: hemerythrin domain-containing protein [Bdellovibrio sp.]
MHILNALRRDHDEVLELIDQILELDADDVETRNELVQQLSDVLIPHARAEEAVLYNSMRMIDAAKELAMDRYMEHMEIEALLRMLQVQELGNFNWKVTALRLRTALEDHILQEESAVFNATEALFTEQEAEAMCEVFLELKSVASEKSVWGTTLDMMTNLIPPGLTDTIKDTWNQRPQRNRHI